jgi:glucose/arabinose dehydrogenase
MRVWLPRNRIAVCLAAAAMVAACSPAPPRQTPNPQPPPAASTTTESTVGLTATAVQVDPELAQAPFDEPRQVLVPTGWTLSVWARMPKPRLAAWTPDGVLLVSVPSTGEVVGLRPGDNGPASSVLLDGLTQPHGLAFAGNTLYVAESDQIDVFDYTDGRAINGRTVAGGLPDADSPELRSSYHHALKSVAIGPDGSVYFSIGSRGNITADDRDADPPRATIMRVPPVGGPAQVFATGVRNGTGLAIAPDGTVWTAVNNRDNVADPQTGQPDPEYVDEHPPESVARLTPGRELGWPYCNPDGGPANLPLIRDVETNADGSRMDCESLPPIEQSVGSHAAPLGMSFTEGVLPQPYASGALIGVHGSWNREPPRAPEVSFFPWRNGVLGDQQTLVGGFQVDDGSRWGRPVAAVTGPDGAVYITDDYADAVYRLAPPR